MTSRSPSAFVLSALVHGAAVAVLLFLGLESQSPDEEPTKVMELVAGPGDNYAATVAPALGSPDSMRIQTASDLPPPPDQTAPLIKAPPMPEPEPQPEPEQAAPSPVSSPVEPDVTAPAPDEPPAQKPVPKALPPKTAPKTTAKPKPGAVDLKRQLMRREHARESALERKYQKQLAAQRKREEARARLSAASGHAAERIDAQGILNGVVGGSTANKQGGAGGTALSREDQDALDTYFAFLKQKLRDNFVGPDGVSDKLEAKVELYLAADGSMSHVHIVHSSGNPDFDRAVLEAFALTHGVGPRPDGRGETITIPFTSHNDDAG